MKLAHLMDHRLVVTASSATSIDEAIREAVAAMDAHHNGKTDFNQVLEKIREREALGGTAFPAGIAIPHAVMEGITDFLVAAIVPRNPIPGPTGVPVSMVWVVVAPSSSATHYLKTIAAIATLSRDGEAMARIRQAGSGQQLVELVERSGVMVEKGLTLADIMSREVISIREDDSVKKLIDLLFAHGLRYLPVVDASGALVGEIGILDVIEAGIPDYAKRLDNLAFLSELEPMERLRRDEASIRACDVMNPPKKLFKPGDSVIAVAFEMAKSRKRHFPVVEGGKVVGVVSAMDILNKVLRA
jgi:PTS system nitrogen regulatory IIA component